MVSGYTMKNDVRTRVSRQNYEETRKLSSYPKSATFNDCLSALLIKLRQKGKKGDEEPRKFFTNVLGDCNQC